MLHLKPKEKTEKRFRFEMYFELLIVFLLGCIITFLLPIMLGVKNSGVRQNDAYFSLIDYLYNKHHFYPFVAIGGALFCIVYFIFQRREQKLIEVLETDALLVFTCRNSFTGKISEKRIVSSVLDVQKKTSKTGDEFFKIYQDNRYLCSFYPKTKPWNQKYDADTIASIIDLFSRIQPDLCIKLNANDEINSYVPWTRFINLSLPLFVFIPLFISCTSIVSVSVLMFILLLIEYAIIQSVVQVAFCKDSVLVLRKYRLFARITELQYSSISKVSYSFYQRDGEKVILHLTTANGKVKKVICSFKNKETTLKVLKRLQDNALQIEFKGLDAKQQKALSNELAMVQSE